MKKSLGTIGFVGYEKTALTKAIINTLTTENTKEMKTINEIFEEQNSIKITNPYKGLEDYTVPSLLYASVSEKLSNYGKKRGSNLTPKKKKRKK